MSFATIEAKVRSAEELGYHSVWLMDHLAAPAAPQHDTFEGWTLAAALAARTSSVRLGHLVTANPLRHPAVLAKMAATVDVVSGGRLELGLGWGSLEDELVTYGIGIASRTTRSAQLGEAIEVIELMFTGEPFDYAGRHFRLKGAVGRPRPLAGRVPVHIGGAGRRLTLPLVARHADWWNCPSYAVDQLEELRPMAGKARVSVQHPVGLAPSTAARAEVEQLTTKRFGAWGGIVTGTPDDVAAALARERRAGVELFILQFHDFATPETLARFAREVIPAL
jgi:alkanesulfonate monooxygenase SsuD/methylene tetrahydromethanopterin reductase-like flavin-dependent oxidoreductase (luciferase family)